MGNKETESASLKAQAHGWLCQALSLPCALSQEIPAPADLCAFLALIRIRDACHFGFNKTRRDQDLQSSQRVIAFFSTHCQGSRLRAPDW